MEERDFTVMGAVQKDVSVLEAVWKKVSVLEAVLEGCVFIGSCSGGQY